MKLNAKISSERASRTVSKSGDEFIRIIVSFKNNVVYDIFIEDDGQQAPKISIAGKNGNQFFPTNPATT